MGVAQSKKRYGSDLTDEQWAAIQPYVETEYRGPGRPRTLDVREVMNGILYLLRTGCHWEMLPKDFPNHNSVRYYFDKWTRDGTLIRVNECLCERVREKEGRAPLPSGGIVDSQTVKTTEAGGERGYDGGKKGHGAQAARAGGYDR